MAYPSAVGTFTDPTSSNKLNAPSHSGIETAQNTAIKEIERFVGTEASTLGTLIYDIRAAASNGGGHVQTAIKGGTGQTTFTKGDILVATGPFVLSKFGVGTDGFAIVADSTQGAGLKYAGVATAAQIQNQTYTYARASVHSASVYAINLFQAVSVLSDGQAFAVKFPTTNTTSILALSVNAQGPSSVAARIKNPDGTNPAVGAIKASAIGIVEFDSVSSVFQLSNTPDAEHLVGTLPAISGANLTNIPTSPYSINADETVTNLLTTQVNMPTAASSTPWTTSGVTFSNAGDGGGFSTASIISATAPLIGIGSAANNMTFASNKIFRLRWGMAVNTALGATLRYGIGVSNAGNIYDENGVGTSSVRFVVNNAALYAASSNGASVTTSSDISSGLTLTTMNIYEIVFTPSVNALFYVNGVLKATIATNLPTSGNALVTFGTSGATNLGLTHAVFNRVA